MEKVFFTTEDNIELSALLWDSSSARSILLIHMMPAVKESWIPLADRLAESGFNVLAIDLRGHGESGGGDYKSFAPEEHYGYFKDQIAAVKFLQEKYPNAELYMGGASIGANLTIKWMADHQLVKKGVALSAGLDYYGVKAIEDVTKLNSDQEILLVGSYDDVRASGSDCGKMAEQLKEVSAGNTCTIIYQSGGHGTDMWAEHPDLINEIVKFYE